MADYVVAVTGGVASGKSEVTRRFEQRGVTVADADIAAREIVAPGQPALAEILSRFGPGSIRADGQLDRPLLRQIVFADPAARRDLEAITHPRIRTWLRQHCERAPGAYAIVAVPLLTEGGGRQAYPWVRRILVIDTPVELQQRRLLTRDAVDPGLAQGMIQAQAGRAARLEIADDIIVNDGPIASLDAIIGKLDTFYRQMSAGH